MALTVAVVEAAIETLISGGQSVTVDGMTYTRASLQSLWELRKQLKAESDRASRPTFRAFAFGSMGYDSGNSTDDDDTPTPVYS